MRNPFILIIAFVLSVCAISDASDIMTVKARGTAVIREGNLDTAKRLALTLARRDAVEQVGTRVVSDTVVETFELVKDRVALQADGYIHAYEIISEGKQGSKYTVEIKAQVSRSALMEDSERLYTAMQKPRLMVVIPEVTGGSSSSRGYAENAVSEFFVSQKFNVIDRATIKQIASDEELRLLAAGDEKAAASVGRRAGAEVIVTGAAQVGNPESVRGVLFSSKATVSIKAVRTDNATVYAVSNINKTKPDATADGAGRKALESAGQGAARDVFAKIVKKWGEQQEQGADIEITLNGVSFSSLGKIVKAARKMENVKAVIQRSFDAPTAVLSVTYKGDAMTLASAMDEYEFKGFDLEVTSASSGKIEIKAIK